MYALFHGDLLDRYHKEFESIDVAKLQNAVICEHWLLEPVLCLIHRTINQLAGDAHES